MNTLLTNILTIPTLLAASAFTPVNAPEKVPLEVKSVSSRISAEAVSVPKETKVSFKRSRVSSSPAPAVPVPTTEPAPTTEVEEIVTIPDVPVVEDVPEQIPEPVYQTASAEEPKEITPPAPAGGVVGTATSMTGVPYVWGGTSTAGWDCSGFVQWVFAQNGKTLPRVAADQAASGTPVSDPQPGDLVLQNGGGHIGVYLGDGMMVSALNPSEGTVVHPTSYMPVSGYYRV